MLALLKHFERLIAWGLGVLLMLVILAATVDLAITLFKGALNGTSHFLIGIDHVIDLLGQFLIVLLGLELLDTVKAYLHDDLIHVAVVLVVAIIALARKVIVLEVKETSPLTLVGLAALVLSLAPSYRMIMQMLREARPPGKKYGQLIEALVGTHRRHSSIDTKPLSGQLLF